MPKKSCPLFYNKKSRNHAKIFGKLEGFGVGKNKKSPDLARFIPHHVETRLKRLSVQDHEL